MGTKKNGIGMKLERAAATDMVACLCALCGGDLSTCSHLCQGHTKSKLDSWNASHSVHRPRSSVSITCVSTRTTSTSNSSCF